MEENNKKKKRKKLFFLLPLMLFIGVCLAVAVNIIYINTVTVKGVKKELSDILNTRKENIKLNINNQYASLDMIAYTLKANGFEPGVRSTYENANEIIKAYEENSEFEYIDIIFTNGVTIKNEGVIEDTKESDFYLGAMEEEKVASIVRDENEKPRLSLSIPFIEKNKVKAVIVGIDSVEETSKMFLSSGNNDKFFITDKYGNYVMGSVSSALALSESNYLKSNICQILKNAHFVSGNQSVMRNSLENAKSYFAEYKLNNRHEFVSVRPLEGTNWSIFLVRPFEYATNLTMQNRMADLVTLVFVLIYVSLIFIYMVMQNRNDMKNMREETDELKYMAEHDDLTGLILRRVFCEKVKKLLYSNNRDDYMIVVLDIEKFKAINDKYGHSRGDELLRYIATGVRNYGEKVRGYSTRLFADYYAMCIPYSKSAPQSLINYLTRHASYSGLPFDVYLAFGIYKITDRDESVDTMIERASLAEKSIKEQYLKSYGVYDDTIRDKVLYEQWVTGIMMTALEDKEFELYVQPQYDYNGDCIGSGEALVRWHRPDGEISPGVFIPLFEKNGFVTLLDNYIWEEAFKLVSDMMIVGDRYVPLSVNISRMDFYKEDIVEEFQRLLKKYEIPVEYMRIEITESAYITDGNAVLEKVEKFSSLGFTVEIDDFGSGYSSLNALKDMPADVLKTDLKFLYGYSEDSSGSVILKHVMQMSQELGMSVVAEGVETKEQADFLHTLGCNIMQGYYYSRPIPAEEFKTLVQENAKLPLKKKETSTEEDAASNEEDKNTDEKSSNISKEES